MKRLSKRIAKTERRKHQPNIGRETAMEKNVWRKKGLDNETN